MGFAADESTPHATGDDSAYGQNDGGSQHDPATPAQMGDKQQYVDEEGEQRQEKRRQYEYQESEQIARGVRGRVQMRSNSQYEQDQGEESGDCVHNQE